MLTVSGGTLLSRVLGLVRDVLMATIFGVGAGMDAFFLAFLIPNLFRRLFGEGALSAAIIPVLAEYRESKSPEDTTRMVSRVTSLLAMALAAVTLVVVAAVLFVPPSAFGYEESEKWTIFSTSLAILAPLVMLLCVSGVLGGVMNGIGKFAVPAILPAVQNLLWIAVVVLIGWLGFGGDEESSRIQVMCVGVLIGGVVVTILQVVALRRAGMPIRFDPDWREPGVRQIAIALGPTLFVVAVFQINTLIDSLLAEWMVEGDGAVSAFSYANRLYQFPLGVVGIAMGTAVFPMLARYAARGEPAKVTGGLLNSLRLLAFIVFPAAAGLLAINSELVNALLRHGAFDAEAAARTSLVLLFFSMALPIVAALQLLTRAFYALRDTKTPMRVALWSVGVNLVANIILVQTPLREAGLALGTGISGLVNLVALGWILRARLRSSIVASGRVVQTESQSSDRMATPMTHGGMRRFWRSLARSATFSAAMAGVVVLGLSLAPPIDGAGGLETLILIGAVTLGAATYAAAHWLARSPEIRELLSRE